MSDLISIELTNLQFLSRHGLFREEQQIGNEFIVDLRLAWTAPDQPIVKLDDTINYVIVYDIVKKEMDIPTPLLETVIMRIADDLKIKFPLLKKISISLKKAHPPIPAFTGSVAAHLERSF